MSDERTCCHCGRAEDDTLDERGKVTVELRPYGPGGADVCYECATATPERVAQTDEAMGAVLRGAMGGGIASITDHGYEPGIPDLSDGS